MSNIFFAAIESLKRLSFKLPFLENNNYKSTPYLRRYGESVFDYDFMMSLNEKDYPYYLSQAYLVKTGQKLNLRHPKTLNEKIQWLKIYDNKPIKSQLTDKILVRDWVREEIGDEYLKPVLWIGDKFDDIPFDSLPISFIVKCNHGCKWQYIIKNKQEFLNKKDLFNSIKMYMENWLIQSYFGWSDFETQYLNIKPKIIIEPLLVENGNEHPLEIEVWCFNGRAKIIQKCKINDKHTHKIINSYNENLEEFNIKFFETNELIHSEADEILNQAKELSEKLAKGFKLVRVDWMIYQNKLYIAEMTFTPHSGFIFFPERHNELQLQLGNMLKLKGE